MDLRFRPRVSAQASSSPFQTGDAGAAGPAPGAAIFPLTIEERLSRLDI